MILDQSISNNDRKVDNDYQRSVWITLGMTGQFVNEKEIEMQRPLAANNSEVERVGPRWYFELLNPQTKESKKIYYSLISGFLC